MTLCRQKTTKQGKICGFPTTIIENSAFAIFTRYRKFSSRNWYHKATAPISTVLFTLCPMSWHNAMELIQNWDNQSQQAKSFQMRYNLSKLNNQNYQTLKRCCLFLAKWFVWGCNMEWKLITRSSKTSYAKLLWVTSIDSTCIVQDIAS